MKYLATIFIAGFLLFPVFTQTNKPKTTKNTESVKKPTPKKTPAAKTTGSKKASHSKIIKSSDQKKTAAAKTSTVKKPAAKTAASNNPDTTGTTGTKPKQVITKTAASKPKPSSTPVKASDEGEEYDKAMAIQDTPGRIAALRKFLADFPQTEKRHPITEMMVLSGAGAANELIKASDFEGAAKMMTAAVKDAPTPVPENMFSGTLIKFLPELFWRGQRTDAIDLAKILEEKSGSNLSQLLSIANFYMSVENGFEAKRVAENALKIDPASAAAHMALGLANRIEFQLDESAAAYAKALELDPESILARRGLAEMKRSIGRSDEAAVLYREILAKDPSNLPAKTGLVLSLFESGKRPDAEAELARTLEATPGNVMLLAGAAYWYAGQGEGPKAIEYAQKAITTDPRFIWSHIALARGHIADRRPMDAERVLLSARRYGNFPTLEYEIASARLMAGFYREAAEELAKSFSVKDGVISTKLGGRVAREAADFLDLTARERRASIFAHNPADTKENAALLKALLDLSTKLGSKETSDEALSKAADEFTGGSDPMCVYRLLFAAKELLDQKRAMPKVLELSRSAVGKDEEGMTVPAVSAAVMADELYDSRRLAAARSEYIRSPEVPRQTLSAILRGRIEELNGWALYQSSDPAEAAVRLKRAVSVLPADSSWWRTSMWRLGAALEIGGKDAEALDAYIKSYRASTPDITRYSVIQAIYKRVNGSTDGLETKVGPNPAPAAESVAERVEPTPTPTIGTTDTAASPSPTPESPKFEATPEPTPVKVEPTAEVKASPTPETVKVDPTPEPSPAKAEPTPSETPTPTPTPETVKVEATPDATPEATPTPVAETAKTEPTPSPSPTAVSPSDITVAKVSGAETRKTEVRSTVGRDGTPIRIGTPVKDLFPPVIITIPVPDAGKKVQPAEEKKTEPAATGTEGEKAGETKPDDPPAGTRARVVEDPVIPKPCTITLSEASVTLETDGGDLAVIVGIEDEADISGIRATSNSPKDVNVRLEPITGIKGRALFVLRSASARPGLYQVSFELPCGKKDLSVRVR